MQPARKAVFSVSLMLACIILGSIALGQVAQSPGTRLVGPIKSINGNSITLTLDGGAEITFSVPDGTRLIRLPLGETNLKNATPIQLQDLQPGDRILVYGKRSEDGRTLTPSTIVAMKQADVAAKQQQDRADWQKRGLSGLVTSVDAAAGTVTISQPSLGGAGKTIVLQTAKNTVIRRYAPDSIKFEDAKLATLADIKPGDQVRARGARSADGTEVSADEIVSGTFRNLAGTVSSTDSAANTVTILDLVTKKTFLVRVTADSQLRKLPPMVAQRIAMRLKGGAGTSAGTGSSGGDAAQSGTSGTSAPAPPQAQSASGGMAERPHGAPDFQQMLARMPPVTVADLQKGDALMILSTEGTPGGVTAITLLAGVEPILQSKGSQSMILSPWSLGGGGGGDAESQ